MLTIGLTGGIASGKSAVADMLAAFGVAVIDTDIIAREVVAPGEPGLQQVVDNFGDAILQPDGRLDRGKLRSQIFADPDKRRQLEAILHPLIRQRALLAAETATRQNPPYLVFVVPLLVETDFARLADRVLVVDADPTLQTQRLMQRDATGEDEATRIIANQADRDTRLQAADDVLENDGSLADLSDAVAALHARYLQIAANQSPATP
jgi:dephospho-CoA kinase